jgi:predicted nucleic acid-binding protein
VASFTALYDACVLYPAPLRDLLMNLACYGLFRARWTEQIHDEWIRSLLKNRPDLDPTALQRTRELMNRAVPDCLVSGHMQLVEALDLPDPDDRHVLAAAICGKAEVIVTFNEKDFPAEKLAPFGIVAQHPDEFVGHMMSLDWSAVCVALKNQRGRLKKPPVTAAQLLDSLEQTGLPSVVSELRPLQELI